MASMLRIRRDFAQPLSQAEKRLIWTTGIGVIAVGAWAYVNAVPEVTLSPVRKAPSPNGFDLYRAADKAVVLWPDIPDESFDSFPFARLSPEKARFHSLERQQKWLQANTTALGFFRQAQQLPSRFPAKDWSDMGGNFPTDRRLGQLKFVESQVRLARGDALGAFNSAFDWLGVRIDENRGHAWFGAGAASNASARIYPAVRASIAQMDENEAKQALTRLEKIEADRNDIHQTLSELHSYVLTLVIPVMRGEGRRGISWRYALIDQTSHSDGITPQQKTALYFISKRAYMSEVEKLFTTANLEAVRPYRAVANLSEEVFYVRVARYMLLATLHAEAATRAQLNSMRTEIALRRYLLAEGHYPKELKDLVPSFLHKVPIDPFSTKQAKFRYRQKGKSYVLYSVGPDQKDDGGKNIDAGGFGGGVSTYLDSKGDFVPGVNK